MLVHCLLRWRGVVILLLHAVAFSSIYTLAYLIRFDGRIPSDMWKHATNSLALVVGLKIAAFIALRGHRGWWRFATFADAVGLVKCATLGALAVACAGLFTQVASGIPRSIILLDWAATIILIGGVRAGSRVFRDSLLPLIRSERRRRAVIVGTTEASFALARELHAHPRLGLEVIGILDTDPSRHGHVVSGVEILGSLDDFDRIAARNRIETVLAPTPAVSPREFRKIAGQCLRVGVDAHAVPGVDALLSGTLTVQPQNVNINNLLCREPVQLDAESIGQFLRGRIILVTGAAGSIGSELCRQVLTFQPARLILLDHSENGLFFLKRELDASAVGTEIVPLVASITDPQRLRSAFSRYQPEVILHAAAHKHVPLMELNAAEAVKNNVFGTRTLADEAVRFGVEAFVLISTDKAVRPTSVMGACKRLAEMYVQSLPRLCSTRFVTVRFGNVLGSNGSVVPVFQEQIRLGEPLTVTHPDMTRYFMTIPEAAQLVLQAGAIGRGGEILVLDMGEPVKIMDLVSKLIRLSGLTEKDVEIAFTGLRPGEKLFEELYDDQETRLPTTHPKIFRAQHRPWNTPCFRAQLDDLFELVNSTDEAVIGALQAIVPEYTKRELSDDLQPAYEYKSLTKDRGSENCVNAEEAKVVHELFALRPLRIKEFVC
jgi:FlaA1/EpsC-like NDP-sugar epimerase